ncbi:hypothetical protein BZA77DRAFT_344862 [Pyronema omphalodes]|nr:hypothetical protein BZA77DRAFT_344862 [Pyronema omphalodes]
MASLWDYDLEDEVFMILANGVVAAAEALVQQEEERKQELARRPTRYRSPIPVPGGEPFSLDAFTEESCIVLFQFTHQHIRTMLQYFALDEITYRYGYKCEPETALCLVLFRLSGPSRYKELMELFKRSRGWLCTIFNDTVEHLVSRYKGKLNWDEKRLTSATIQRYEAAIEGAGGFRRIWGFLDVPSDYNT